MMITSKKGVVYITSRLGYLQIMKKRSKAVEDKILINLILLNTIAY